MKLSLNYIIPNINHVRNKLFLLFCNKNFIGLSYRSPVIIFLDQSFSCLTKSTPKGTLFSISRLERLFVKRFKNTVKSGNGLNSL